MSEDTDSRAEAASSGKPLWRNRDFNVLWTGQAVTAVGAGIAFVCYPIIALAYTRSPAAAGWLGFVQTLPYLLLYLPVGALVDRSDRRRVMQVSSAVRAVAMAVLAAGLALGHFSLLLMMVVAFVDCTMQIAFELAENSVLPAIVPAGQLPSAIASNQARETGASLLGPPLGGVLVAVAFALPFGVNAAAYAISFGTLSFLRATLPRRASSGTPSRLHTDIAEGVRWLWRHPIFRLTVPVSGIVNLAFSAVPLILIVQLRETGLSNSVVGVLFAGSGVAGILGATLAPVVQRRLSRGVVIAASLWLWACQLAAMAFARNFFVLMALNAAAPLLGVMFNVVVGTMRYELVPEALRARTQSVSRLVAHGTMPLGALLGGLLVQSWNARAALLSFSGLMLITAIVATMALPSLLRGLART